MNILLLVFSVFLSSCSQTSLKPKLRFEEVKYNRSDIDSCLEYKKKVLESAYLESKGAQGNEFVFVKDIKQARNFLNQFDVTKGLVQLKSNTVQNILIQCDDHLIKKFDQTYKELAQCTPLFSELNYFQALATGIKKYSWPVDLKLEGKKIALDYVKYVSDGSHPLLNRLVALSVLDELSVNEIVNKELHQEIKKVMQDSRSYVEGLRNTVKQEEGFSCKSLNVIRDELGYSNQVALKLKDFLSRI